ncbi:MAG: hypothetical protein DSZ06_02220 [Sulfurospirillum sp.]|nr:MAG: hypothetical protein DSZ06_02220 [Sulfurospirillum sp.]
MELVYLWIKEYKNIKNQGFNFHSRFNCDFDDTTNKLTISEDENYIDGFFGKNINVTAIVGKNGSGKSSLLDLLEHVTIKHFKFEYIIVFLENNELYYSIPQNMKIETSIKNERECYSEGMMLPTFTATRLLKDNLAINVGDDYSLSSVDILHFYGSSQVSRGFSKNNNLGDVNFLVPFYIKLYKDNPNLFTHLDFMPNFDVLRIKWGNRGEELFKIIPHSGTLQRKHIEEFIKKNYDNKFKLEDETVNLLSFLYRKIRKDKYIDIEIDELISNNFLKPLDSVRKIFTDEHDEEQVNKKSLSLFTFNLIDSKKNMRFDELSSGEKQFFRFSIELFFQLTLQVNSGILLFDEIDNSLHPVWKKRVVKILINLINDIGKQTGKNFHIIFTTHSPFLISDIPKQNIIFLDRDENGYCKVVDGLKEKKQTFGANIHTLLSDSFFMEEGLMGEFAKSKINEIIEFHKEVEEDGSDKDSLKKEYDSKKSKFWQTQSLIGEDYLRQVIKNHLVDIESILLGENEARSNEIQRLRDEADKLERL